MKDEVISTTPKRENSEFIKSSVDDLVPIPRDLELNGKPEHLDTLLTGDREIDFNPSKDIEELERLLADDPVPVPVPRVFDEPLSNSDLVSRSYDVTFSNPLFDFNDDYTLCYDNPLFDEEFEDISSLDPPS
nr:NAC domain-containing protein [Tanacetum cinerariifolium]